MELEKLKSLIEAGDFDAFAKEFGFTSFSEMTDHAIDHFGTELLKEQYRDLKENRAEMRRLILQMVDAR